MLSKGKMKAKCNIRINKHKKHNLIIPKSSESFVWKDTNWKKIELRLNIIQNKIYMAKKEKNTQKVIKLQKLIIIFYNFKKLVVRKVTQLNRGKKTAGVDGIIETDHINPIAGGGSYKITNLQFLHAVCHDKKGIK